jgi:lipopolysaccharide export system protein LptC
MTARDRAGARLGRGRRRRGPLIGYRAAMTLLKIALPAVAVALLVIVALWPQYLLVGGRFQLAADPSGENDLDRLSMVNPHFKGRDLSNRPFTVSAERAVQDAKDEELVLLAKPQAEITLENGAWVALKAEQGFYRRDLETLRLTGGVELFHDQGYEIHTPSAAIDLNGGTAEGHERVDAQGPFGALTSQGFRVAERGDVVEFTGKSRLVLESDAEGRLP